MANAPANDRTNRATPVVATLHCRETGRVLAADIAPADGHLYHLIHMLSGIWPVDFAPGGSPSKDGIPGNGVPSRGH